VSKRSTLLVVLAVSMSVSTLGCADPIDKPVAARRLFAQFRTEVYPVLLRDCGFPGCHGEPERFLRVLGPGRNRLPNDDGTLPEPFDLPTAKEQELTFQLALSMIDESQLEDSLLLRKPLAVEAGGYGHLGGDRYGRNVYRTTQDPGYVAIARWVFSPPPMMPGSSGAGGAAAGTTGAAGMMGASGTGGAAP
jgi:hypothetical protein